MAKGICLECNKPMINPEAYGYHRVCARIAHARRDKEMDDKFPFIVKNYMDEELERFSTKIEAEEYIDRMSMLEIEVVSG